MDGHPVAPSPLNLSAAVPQRRRGMSHPAVESPSPSAHLRAFRSPSVLVEGWSFKTLMQPFIWWGSKRGWEQLGTSWGAVSLPPHPPPQCSGG